MPHLRGLSLYGAGFSGDGLEHLTAVEVLDLTDTDVRDDAMPKLATMRNLKSLSLAGTKITDAGLEHLKGLTQLRSLWLGGRGARPEGVTTEGINGFKGRCPTARSSDGSPATPLLYRPPSVDPNACQQYNHFFTV